MNITKNKVKVYVNKEGIANRLWANSRKIQDYFEGIEEYNDEFMVTTGYEVEHKKDVHIALVYLIAKRSKENDLCFLVNRLSGDPFYVASYDEIVNTTDSYIMEYYNGNSLDYKTPDYDKLNKPQLKQKVKQIPVPLNGNSDNAIFDQACSALGLYAMFKDVKLHGSALKLAKDTLYSICNIDVPKVKFLKPIEIDLKDFNMKYCQDWGYLEETEEGTINITPITYKNMFLAYYLEDYHSLITCDFAHNSNYTYFEPFIKWLEKNLFPKQYNKVEKKTDIKVTIGCDPEFELVSPHGGVIDASKIIATICKANGIDYYSSKYGIDGACSQVELRPKASHNVDEVIKDIQDTLDEYQEFELSVEGNEYPLGAHIHVGLTVDGKQVKAPQTNEMIKSFDDFFGRVFYKMNGSKRGEYKKLSQWRSQPHGFEYRSLPSAAFENPKIARIVMKGIQKLCENIYKSSIEYNIPPTYEDYAKYCGLTKEEYARLVNFDKEFDGSAIISKWVDKKQRYPLKITSTIESEFVDRLRSQMSNIKFKEEHEIVVISDKKNVGVGYPSWYIYKTDVPKLVIGLDEKFVDMGIGFSYIVMNLIWACYAMQRKHGKLSSESLKDIVYKAGNRYTEVELPESI